MKNGREHRVPLSEQALRLVRARQEVSFCVSVPEPNRPRS